MEPIYDDSLENLLRITGMDTKRAPNQQDNLITKTKEYNSILNELAREGSSEEELGELIVEMVMELDKECPYIYQPVLISGLIDRGVNSSDVEGDEAWSLVTEAVDELVVQSLGFAWRYRSGEWEIVHTFSLLQDREIAVLSGVVEKSTTPRAYAGTDTVSIDYTHSPKEASDALENIAEDLIHEIDEALYNPTSLTEVIQRLGAVRPAEIYNDLPTGVLEDVATYVMGILALDATVPVELEIKHSYTSEDESGESFIMIPDPTQLDGGAKRVFGYISGVVLTDGREIAGGKCIVTEEPHFALTIKVVHDENIGGEADYEINVLMQDIGYCESLRDLLRAS